MATAAGHRRTVHEVLGELAGSLVADGSGPVRAGLRRVDWVRLTVDEREVRAEVIGVGFRLPVVRPIPLSIAGELIASGTPCVTSRVPSEGRPW